MFEEKKDVGIVSCSIFLLDEKGKVTPDTPKKNYSGKKEFYRNLIINNIVSGGSAAVIKKECFDKVGYFDEELNSAEDWDMWLRIAQLYKIEICERPLLEVRVNSGSMSAVKNAERMLQMN